MRGAERSAPIIVTTIHSNSSLRRSSHVLPPQDAFDPTDDHLAIIGTSGKKVTKIGGLGAPLKFKIICLRSHLIEKMEGLEGHSETLEVRAEGGAMLILIFSHCN